MKLLKWAIGGASAYVIYKYSIGRKARGEDVFVTPEKAVEKIAAETAPARKPARRKASPANKASTAVKPAGGSHSEKPKRKRAPRKVEAKS